MRLVLDDLLEVVPRKRKVFTRQRLVAVAQVAAQVLSLVVLKRPSLAPLQAVLSALMAPAKNDVPVSDQRFLFKRLRETRAKLEGASDDEQVRLRAQLDMLMAMLLEESGEPAVD